MRSSIAVLLVSLLPATSAFEIIWNAPSEGCATRFNRSLPLDDYDIAHNDAQAFYGERIVIFYAAKLGQYPHVTKKGRAVNGGVPQAANLASHLKAMSADINRVMPQTGYSGLAVIDYESWWPDWKALRPAEYRVYRKLSLKIVHELHRNLTTKQQRRLARKQFNMGSKRFMLATIHMARQLRPYASWGFYGYPLCNNAFNGNCSALSLKLNRRWRWLYQASTALYPTIYQKTDQVKKFTSEQRFLRSRATILAAISAVKRWKTPVYPYSTFSYDPYERPLPFYAKSDLCTNLKQAADLGARGAVLWSSFASVSDAARCGQVRNYLLDLLGPYSLIVVDQTRRCALKLCSDHGSCVLPPQPRCATTTAFERYRCRCVFPYKGPHCQKSRFSWM